MKRIGMGIVGAGFVGPHHIDAVRRLGYVDVVAVAGSSQASADKKAEALGARKGYGSYEALLTQPPRGMEIPFPSRHVGKITLVLDEVVHQHDAHRFDSRPDQLIETKPVISS